MASLAPLQTTSVDTEALHGDRQVEELLSEKLLEGYQLLETACPHCYTPLLVKNKTPVALSPRKPLPVSRAVSPHMSVSYVSVQLQPSSSDFAGSPTSSVGEQQPFAPVHNVPYCVSCQAHVVTSESHMATLERNNALKDRGSIILALSEDEREEHDIASPGRVVPIEQHAFSDERDQPDSFNSLVDSEDVEETSSDKENVLVEEEPIVVDEGHDDKPAEEEDIEADPCASMEETESPAEEEEEEDIPIDNEAAVLEAIEKEMDLPVEKTEVRQTMEHAADRLAKKYPASPSVAAFLCASTASYQHTVVPSPEPSPKTSFTERSSSYVEEEGFERELDEHVHAMEKVGSEAAMSALLPPKPIESGLLARDEEEELDRVREKMSPHVNETKTDGSMEQTESQEEALQEYSVRRDIATKVLGAKMLHGYTLMETQCLKCGMPLMENAGQIDCVVCPVLVKKAKKKAKEEEEARLLAEKKALIEAEIAAEIAATKKAEEEARLLASKKAKEEEEAKLLAEKRAKEEEEAKRLAEIKAKEEAEAKRLAEKRAKEEEEAKRLAEKKALMEAEIAATKKAEEEAFALAAKARAQIEAKEKAALEALEAKLQAEAEQAEREAEMQAEAEQAEREAMAAAFNAEEDAQEDPEEDIHPAEENEKALMVDSSAQEEPTSPNEANARSPDSNSESVGDTSLLTFGRSYSRATEFKDSFEEKVEEKEKALMVDSSAQEEPASPSETNARSPDSNSESVGDTSLLTFGRSYSRATEFKDSFEEKVRMEEEARLDEEERFLMDDADAALQAFKAAEEEERIAYEELRIAQLEEEAARIEQDGGVSLEDDSVLTAQMEELEALRLLRAARAEQEAANAALLEAEEEERVAKEALRAEKEKREAQKALMAAAEEELRALEAQNERDRIVKEALEEEERRVKEHLEEQERRALEEAAEKDRVRKQEIELAQKARLETEEEARLVAEEKEKEAKRIAEEKEALLLEQLEREASEKARAAEKAMLKAQKALDNVSTARKQMYAKTIAQAEVEAVAEAEAIAMSEGEGYKELPPSKSFIDNEYWETLRMEGRALTTRRVLQGWTVTTSECRGVQCNNNFLVSLKKRTECTICGGTGTGLDGAYQVEIVDDESMTSSKDEGIAVVDSPAPSDAADKNLTATSLESNTSEAHISEHSSVEVTSNSAASSGYSVDNSSEEFESNKSDIETDELRVETVQSSDDSREVIDSPRNTIPRSPLSGRPPMAPIDGKSGAVSSPQAATTSPRSSSAIGPSFDECPVSPTSSVSRSVSEMREDFEAKRNYVSKEIGKKMMKGWLLLDSSCPECLMPLLSDPQIGQETCVLCGPTSHLPIVITARSPRSDPPADPPTSEDDAAGDVTEEDQVKSAVESNGSDISCEKKDEASMKEEASMPPAETKEATTTPKPTPEPAAHETKIAEETTTAAKPKNTISLELPASFDMSDEAALRKLIAMVKSSQAGAVPIPESKPSASESVTRDSDSLAAEFCGGESSDAGVSRNLRIDVNLDEEDAVEIMRLQSSLEPFDEQSTVSRASPHSTRSNISVPERSIASKASHHSAASKHSIPVEPAISSRQSSREPFDERSIPSRGSHYSVESKPSMHEPFIASVASHHTTESRHSLRSHSREPAVTATPSHQTIESIRSVLSKADRIINGTSSHHTTESMHSAHSPRPSITESASHHTVESKHSAPSLVLRPSHSRGECSIRGAPSHYTVESVRSPRDSITATPSHHTVESKHSVHSRESSIAATASHHSIESKRSGSILRIPSIGVASHHTVESHESRRSPKYPLVETVNSIDTPLQPDSKMFFEDEEEQSTGSPHSVGEVQAASSYKSLTAEEELEYSRAFNVSPRSSPKTTLPPRPTFHSLTSPTKASPAKRTPARAAPRGPPRPEDFGRRPPVSPSVPSGRQFVALRSPPSAGSMKSIGSTNVPRIIGSPSEGFRRRDDIGEESVGGGSVASLALESIYRRIEECKRNLVESDDPEYQASQAALLEKLGAAAVAMKRLEEAG